MAQSSLGRRKFISFAALGVSCWLPTQTSACLIRRRRCGNTPTFTNSIPQGFSTEPFEFYKTAAYRIKLVYFFSSSFNVNEFDNAVHDQGQPNEGATLTRNAGQYGWRLGSREYLVLGAYDHYSKDKDWYAAYNHPDRWEGVSRSGRQGFGNGSSRSKTLLVGGQEITIRYYNPPNTGGWSGNDIVYEVSW